MAAGCCGIVGGCKGRSHEPIAAVPLHAELDAAMLSVQPLTAELYPCIEHERHMPGTQGPTAHRSHAPHRAALRCASLQWGWTRA